jgi:hypothetical protein
MEGQGSERESEQEKVRGKSKRRRRARRTKSWHVEQRERNEDGKPAEKTMVDR